MKVSVLVDALLSLNPTDCQCQLTTILFSGVITVLSFRRVRFHVINKATTQKGDSAMFKET